MESELPPRLSVSLQPLSCGSSVPLPSRYCRIGALMRSAAGGDEAGEAPLGGGGPSARGQESAKHPPRAGGRAPRGSASHARPSVAASTLTCATASLTEGPRPQSGERAVGGDRAGAESRKGGGGGREGSGGRDRRAVNKDLPLCEVRRRVPRSPLPGGPSFVGLPTREPPGSGAAARAPGLAANIRLRAGPTCPAGRSPARLPGRSSSAAAL